MYISHVSGLGCSTLPACLGVQEGAAESEGDSALLQGGDDESADREESAQGESPCSAGGAD